VLWKRHSQHNSRDGRKNGLVEEVTQVVIKTWEDGEREEENGSAPLMAPAPIGWEKIGSAKPIKYG
jgi:hypothetical protein